MEPPIERAPPPVSLQRAAQRLHDPRLAHLVASYGEYHVSLRRVLLLVLTIAWSLYWERFSGPSHSHDVLAPEAAVLRPWAELFLAVSFGWMVAVRGRLVRTSGLVDGLGAAANLAGIGIMLHLAWTLTIAMVTLLPLAAIMAGARFGRRVFLVAVFCSLVVLLVAAPPHYWSQRPAFLAFALVLLIGLPLTVYRLLDTIGSVSQAALHSRDAQSRFLATMSHELRTPLNTVVHVSSLIDHSRLDPTDRQLMQSLRANACALLQRVNDVLDVAAIDAGRLHFAHEPFLLANVLDQVRDVVGPLARQKDVTLRVVQGRQLEEPFVGDAGRIAQVLINLGTNAVKFTPWGGEVGIELRLADNGPGPARLLCTVTDTGPGVAEELRPRIFEPFYQASDGPARRHEGTGLGLHIVRSICHQLGGRVAVADNPGGGSVFTVMLPLERAPAQQAVVEPLDTLAALDAHRAGVPALKCLVVDDNRASRDTLGHLLRRAGHQVCFAGTAEEGLQAMLGPRRPDVVFLDLHMPDLSGLEVLARQRRHASPVPVVMLSADSDPDAIERAIAQGAIAYLTKPVAIERLLGLLRTIHSNGAQGPEPRAAPAPVSRPAESSLSVICRIATPEQRQAYLLGWRRELEQDAEQLLRALEAAEVETAAAHLHRLQNAFLVIGQASALPVCTRLRDLIRSHGPAAAALAELQDELAIAHAMLRDRMSPPDTSAAGRA